MISHLQLAPSAQQSKPLSHKAATAAAGPTVMLGLLQHQQERQSM
jgi:hypothetical protein